LEIYKITKDFPKEELFGITSQLRRASISIPANLAEGSTRDSSKEFKQFISIARGSLAEVETWLDFCCDLNYISKDRYNSIIIQVKRVAQLLVNLQKSIKLQQ
jgi:four helix bundle protein